MKIVRLVYCSVYKDIYQLINIGGDYYWKKTPYSSNMSELLPLYINAKDTRYLSFCRGMYKIRFMEGDL